MSDGERLDGAMARVREGRDAPFGWAPLVALVFVTLVDRIETSVVAGVLPLLQDEWGFGDTAGGAIPTAAAVAGLLVTLPAGLLADRVDRRRLVAWVVGSWSLVIAGSALATGFGVFFMTRVVLGAADSLEGPSAASLLSDYYPPRARARAYGYHRMATFAGAPIGALLGGVTGELFGWRAAFFFMVIPGLLVAWFVRRLPEPRRGAVDREVALAVDPEPEGALPEPVGTPAVLVRDGLRTQIAQLFRVATVARVYVGLFMLFLGLGGVAFWLPSFFERVHDLSEGAAAAVAAGIGIVGVGVGATLGGVLGDRLHGRRSGARIVIGGGGQLAGAVVGLAAFLGDGFAYRVPMLALAIGLLSLGIPTLSAAIADVLPARRRGVGFALLNFMVVLGGAFGPLAVGGLSDALGDLSHALAALAAPMVLGSLVVLRARATYHADAAAVLAQARHDASPEGGSGGAQSEPGG